MTALTKLCINALTNGNIIYTLGFEIGPFRLSTYLCNDMRGEHGDLLHGELIFIATQLTTLVVATTVQRAIVQQHQAVFLAARDLTDALVL